MVTTYDLRLAKSYTSLSYCLHLCHLHFQVLMEEIESEYLSRTNTAWSLTPQCADPAPVPTGIASSTALRVNYLSRMVLWLPPPMLNDPTPENPTILNLRSLTHVPGSLIICNHGLPHMNSQ